MLNLIEHIAKYRLLYCKLYLFSPSNEASVNFLFQFCLVASNLFIIPDASRLLIFNYISEWDLHCWLSVLWHSNIEFIHPKRLPLALFMHHQIHFLNSLLGVGVVHPWTSSLTGENCYSYEIEFIILEVNILVHNTYGRMEFTGQYQLFKPSYVYVCVGKNLPWWP